jgi:hypothetical protein
MGVMTDVVLEDGGREPSSCTIAAIGMGFFATKVIE